MKMRQISGDKKTGERLASGPVRPIRGNVTDDLNGVSCSGVDNRASANSVNSNAVDQIGFVNSRANVSGEKAERVGFHSRITKPAHLNAQPKRVTGWEQWYTALWKIKNSDRDQNER